jgi:hypothetical protein
MCWPFPATIVAKDATHHMEVSNQTTLGNNLNNISIAINKEVEYLHRQASQFHDSLANGIQSRNITLDPSYLLEFNKTMKWFLRNITEILLDLDDLKAGNEASMNQSRNVPSLDNTTNYSFENWTSNSTDELVSTQFESKLNPHMYETCAFMTSNENMIFIVLWPTEKRSKKSRGGSARLSEASSRFSYGSYDSI